MLEKRVRVPPADVSACNIYVAPPLLAGTLTTSMLDKRVKVPSADVSACNIHVAPPLLAGTLNTSLLDKRVKVPSADVSACNMHVAPPVVACRNAHHIAAGLRELAWRLPPVWPVAASHTIV
jgi:hypothetical protein